MNDPMGNRRWPHEATGQTTDPSIPNTVPIRKVQHRPTKSSTLDGSFDGNYLVVTEITSTIQKVNDLVTYKGKSVFFTDGRSAEHLRNVRLAPVMVGWCHHVPWLGHHSEWLILRLHFVSKKLK